MAGRWAQEEGDPERGAGRCRSSFLGQSRSWGQEPGSLRNQRWWDGVLGGLLCTPSLPQGLVCPSGVLASLPQNWGQFSASPRSPACLPPCAWLQGQVRPGGKKSPGPGPGRVDRSVAAWSLECQPSQAGKARPELSPRQWGSREAQTT